MKAKIISAILASALVGGTATYMLQQQQIGRLRAENESMEGNQLKLSNDLQAALSAAAQKTEQQEMPEKDLNELLRLRSEVGQLRKQADQLKALQAENRAMRDEFANAMDKMQQMEQDKSQDDPQHQALIKKLNEAKQVVLAMIVHANDNNNQWPADFGTVAHYLNLENFEGTNNFQIVIHGSTDGLTNASSIIALRQNTPIVQNGVRLKVYGYADGHAEVRKEPEEGFDAWEQQHMQNSQ